jgi:hypothetical protein
MVKDRFFVDFAKSHSRGAIEDFLDQGGAMAGTLASSVRDFALTTNRPRKDWQSERLVRFMRPSPLRRQGNTRFRGEGLDQEACARSWIVSSNCWAG